VYAGAYFKQKRRVEPSAKEKEMDMLADEKILEVRSPRERPEGRDIHGPWFVLKKTLVNGEVEAYVLLDWREDPNTPFVPSIGKRTFQENGLGEPQSNGYPYWRIQPPSILDELSLPKELKTIAEDFLGDGENRLSSVCLNTISNLKQTLELACFEEEQILNYCYTIYQRLKKGRREENEKEASIIKEDLKRIVSASNGRPAKQTLEEFGKEYFLPLQGVI
jgi:hypothetical protein